MIIQLDEYRKAKQARLAHHDLSAGAQEERQCVNWNPAFGVIALSCYQSPQELSPKLPDDTAALDSELMNRIYALASQI